MARKTEILLGRWLCPHHFVILLVLFSMLSFIVAYGMSVGLSHVPALFPYISDTGAKPPASCVFGLLLNIAAMMAFITMYVRHAYLEKYGFLESTVKLHMLNDVSMFIGFFSVLGIMIVASFQWTNVLSVHIIGALMAFVLGNIYCWIQSYLSNVVISVGLSSKIIFYVRVVLSLVASLFLISTFVAGSVAVSKGKKSGGNDTYDNLYWDSQMPGYDAHLVSTFSEWIMVFSFLLFFLTYYGEFKYLMSSVHIECFGDPDRLTPVENSQKITVQDC